MEVHRTRQNNVGVWLKVCDDGTFDKWALFFITAIPSSSLLMDISVSQFPCKVMKWSVADPGFPRRGHQPQRWGAQFFSGNTFAESCIKGIGPTGGGTCPWRPMWTLLMDLNNRLFTVWKSVQERVKSYKSFRPSEFKINLQKTCVSRASICISFCVWVQSVDW